MNKSETFLKQLSIEIQQLQTENEIVIILPNKRAKVFLLEHLKNNYENYQFPPKILNIEEFIVNVTGLKTIDNLDLLLLFYTVYVENTIKEQIEPFETFSNWAPTLLQDFIEIDQYLIEPNKLFEYLKEIEVLKRWQLKPENKTKLIENYLYFWEQLPLYYSKLNEKLLAKKLSHSGLNYRNAVENIDNYLNYNQNFFCFCWF